MTHQLHSWSFILEKLRLNFCGVHTNTYMQICKEVLFITAKKTESSPNVLQ